MKGKKVDASSVESTLNKFLEDEQHLIFGFEKQKDRIVHRLFRNDLHGYSLFNPYFGINGAIYLKRLFSKSTKIILILRPCEIRAYIELTKLTQVERESIIAVSVDCFGAVSLKEKIEDVPADPVELKEYFASGEKLRPACAACRERRGIVGDAGIRIDKSGSIWILPYTEQGETLSNLIEGSYEENTPDMLIGESPKQEKFQSNMETFGADFSKCIMCMNCRDMCPVCYCLDCVFNGDEYMPKGDALLNKIYQKGSTDLPQNKEIFHFIRMYHVSQTCVGCGACEEACPQGIPLAKYFKGTSERMQDVFSYMSGMSFDEEIPFTTFLEDELKNAAD
ncbi:MAG: 4Fe-4S binding protein [Spirochaetes bacterium]|nr:4Fe-4S binding protein [Spirochaetota bacterium]